MPHQTNKQIVTCTSIRLPGGRNFSQWIDYRSSQAERNAVYELSLNHFFEFGIHSIPPNKSCWLNEQIEAFTICDNIEDWRNEQYLGTTQELIGYAMFMNDEAPTELLQVYLLPNCRRRPPIKFDKFRTAVVERYGERPISVYPHFPASLAKLFEIQELNLHQDG